MCRLMQTIVDNSDIISKYIDAMQVEVNPTPNYKGLTLLIVTKLSRYYKERPIRKMKRDDIIVYLNSIRKTEKQDHMHKWIGTYNLYLTCITRFFKWLYFPNQNPNDRRRPMLLIIFLN